MTPGRFSDVMTDAKIISQVQIKTALKLSIGMKLKLRCTAL